jgi:hypothetical protein
MIVVEALSARVAVEMVAYRGVSGWAADIYRRRRIQNGRPVWEPQVRRAVVIVSV